VRRGSIEAADASDVVRVASQVDECRPCVVEKLHAWVVLVGTDQPSDGLEDALARLDPHTLLDLMPNIAALLDRLSPVAGVVCAARGIKHGDEFTSEPAARYRHLDGKQPQTVMS
jgi:hypothetical protein